MVGSQHRLSFFGVAALEDAGLPWLHDFEAEPVVHCWKLLEYAIRYQKVLEDAMIYYKVQ